MNDVARLLAHDSWATFSGNRSDGAFVLRVRTPILRPPADIEHTEQLAVCWPYADEATGAMPSRGTNTAMQRFENRLCAAWESDGLALLAAVLTFDGARQWVFYTSDITTCLDRLHAMPQERERYPIELTSEHDPSWSYLHDHILKGVNWTEHQADWHAAFEARTTEIASDRPTKTLDDRSRAEDPGQLALSHSKLRELRPDLYGITGLIKSLLTFLKLTWPQRTYLEEQLLHGDSRAAIVVSTAPLLIAAYTDELDCVAILRFPDTFTQKYRLATGTRLLTINLYSRETEYDSDLIPGPNECRRWTGFHPVIAEFLSEDIERIEARKREIDDTEWKRAQAMGASYLRERPGVARDGRPVFSSDPAPMPEHP